MSHEPQMLIVGGKRGRPPRAGTRATQRLEIVVTTTERADLQQIAKSERRPLAAILRDAMNEYVADCRDRVVFLPSGDTFKKR